MNTTITPRHIQDTIERLEHEVHKTLRGCDKTLRIAMLSMLAGGNLGIRGRPGTGKSLMAEAVAAAIGGEASIFTCVPDMTPSDLTGSEMFDQAEKKMVTVNGLINPDSNLVLADEFNRMSPRTSAAMLESMQSHRVRQGRQVRKMAKPTAFWVVNNPLESAGTYAMSDAAMDRLMAVTVIGYAKEEDMLSIVLDNNLPQENPIAAAGVQKVLQPDELLRIQNFIRDEVKMPREVAQYIVRFVLATRPPDDPDATDDPCDGYWYKKCMPEQITIGGKTYQPKEDKLGHLMAVGSSNRGLLAMMMMAKASAVMMGNTEVTFDNVKDIAVAALAHRLTTNPRKLMTYPPHAMRVVVKELMKTVPINA